MTTDTDIRECYGLKYGKIKACEGCKYSEYCQSSQELDKPVVNTTKDQCDFDIPNISDQEKANNVTGLLMAKLLELTNFDPIKYFVVTCRLGNLTHKEIGYILGVTDAAVYKIVDDLPPALKKYLKHKTLTFLELEQALKHYKKPKTRSRILNSLVK